jgi:hypothetical protein
MKQLVRQGYLKSRTVPTKYRDKIILLYHHKLDDNQMMKRVTNTAKLIDRYSNPRVARATSINQKKSLNPRPAMLRYAWPM